MNQQPFPNLQSKITDDSGGVSPVWRAFFQSLWTRTGGALSVGFATLAGSSTQVFNVAPAVAPAQAVNLAQTTALLSGYQPVGSYAALSGNATQTFDVQTAVATSNAVPLAQATTLIASAVAATATASGAALASITVGASPYVYTATTRGAVAVSGGTVSAASLTRGSAVTLPIAGLFPVSAGDTITVTYTVAPTMTFVPS